MPFFHESSALSTVDVLIRSGDGLIVTPYPVRPAAGEPGTLREQLALGMGISPENVTPAHLGPVIYRIEDYRRTECE